MAENKKTKTTSFFNSNLTTTLSISLVLFLVGLITMLTLLGSQLTTYVKENISFSIVLQDKVTLTEVVNIQDLLKQAPYKKSFKYISKDRAIKELVADLGEDPEDFLGYNPLSASFEVKTTADYANAESIKEVKEELLGFSGVKEIIYHENMINKVNKNLKTLSALLLGVAGLLLIISIGLINNTIRLQIYSKRFTINTMKLVGATAWFIRKPFLGKSLLNGIIASLLSIIILGGLIYYVEVYHFSILQMLDINSILIIGGSVLFLGVIISLLSSLVAVGKYLRFKTNDLYYI